MSADAILPKDRFLATLHIVAKESVHLEWSRARLFSETINQGWVESLVVRFIEAVYKAIGVGADLARVDAINRGESQIEHIAYAVIGSARKSGFEATIYFAQRG